MLDKNFQLKCISLFNTYRLIKKKFATPTLTTWNLLQTWQQKPSWLPCGASYPYVASVARSTATTEQTLLELGDPSTKCKSCFHRNDTRTSSHPLWRITELSGYSFPLDLLIGEGNGSRQFAVSNCICTESPAIQRSPSNRCAPCLLKSAQW